MGYQVQVSIPYFSAVPKDVVTNVWNFSWNTTGSPGSSDFIALRNQVANFYEQAFLSSSSCDMSPWMRPSLTRYKIYNLDDHEPRVPVYDSVNALNVKVGTTSNVPTEVSLCLSYKSTAISGIPLASQRGRIYVGGIGSSCFTVGSSTTFTVPAALFITQLSLGAHQTVVNGATTHWQWNVLSRKLGIAFPVTSGWIDNAWDTQRRRGQAASARTTWT